MGSQLHQEVPLKKNRAILYSAEEWNKILSSLDVKQRREEEVENNRREVAEGMEVSKRLKSSFVDSHEAERIRQQLEREKIKRAEELQKLEDEKRRENEEIVKQTRLALQRNKDGWKTLDSTLRLVDTLRERKKQEAFRETLDAIEKANEQSWADKVLQDARDFQAEQEKERREKIIRKHKSFERISTCLKEREEENTRLQNLQLQEELREIAKVQGEIKAIKEKEREEKEESKRTIEQMTRESLDLEMRKRWKEKEEEELDKAAYHILKETTGRLTDMKNQIMQQRHEAELTGREKIRNHIASLMRRTEDNEEARIKRVLEKAEEKVQEKLKVDNEKKRRLAREKVESYQQYLRGVQEAERQREETIQREMVKRSKMNEHDKMKEEEEKQREKKKRENQRADLDKQMEELKLYNSEIAKADKEAVKRSTLLWQEDDALVMKYGEQLLRECESKQRPTLPVVKAMRAFQRLNKMVPPISKNLSQWESNVMARPKLLNLHKY